MTELERAQFDFQLEQPPPWELTRPPSAEQQRSDADTFMAALAGFERPGG